MEWLCWLGAGSMGYSARLKRASLRIECSLSLYAKTWTKRAAF
jgi:hypothetical protein